MSSARLSLASSKWERGAVVRCARKLPRLASFYPPHLFVALTFMFDLFHPAAAVITLNYFFFVSGLISGFSSAGKFDDEYFNVRAAEKHVSST